MIWSVPGLSLAPWTQSPAAAALEEPESDEDDDPEPESDDDEPESEDDDPESDDEESPPDSFVPLREPRP